jgi:hypothetical protein
MDFIWQNGSRGGENYISKGEEEYLTVFKPKYRLRAPRNHSGFFSYENRPQLLYLTCNIAIINHAAERIKSRLRFIFRSANRHFVSFNTKGRVKKVLRKTDFLTGLKKNLIVSKTLPGLFKSVGTGTGT